MKISLLTQSLAKPESIARFSEQDWDTTIRQARASGLLATLFHLAKNAGVISQLPKPIQTQLAAAHTIAERHQEVTRWEVEELHRNLENIGVPVIVLKGAAYVMANLESSKGRLFGDVDIMVPHGALTEVERVLGRTGWIQENQSAYDDRYYRQWMHEIPARRHFERGTVLDVHHNILPITASCKPAAKELWRFAKPLPGFNDLYVLAPEDMVLHCAAHLFLNGEFERGLRDLFDFHRLYSEFSTKNKNFWGQLQSRAIELDLTKPLVLAARYAIQLFHTAIPNCPKTYAAPLIDSIFERGLRPNHSSTHDFFTSFALFALYVRGHYHRMPLHLLLPHLIYKGTWAKFDEEKIQNKKTKSIEEFRAFLGK